MKRLALLITFLAAAASAEQFRIEPAAPASRSFVMLHVPCNSSDPAFAAVDLNALFPSVPGRVRSVGVHPELLGTRPYWALLSITNNATQRVTMITPQ